MLMVMGFLTSKTSMMTTMASSTRMKAMAIPMVMAFLTVSTSIAITMASVTWKKVGYLPMPSIL